MPISPRTHSKLRVDPSLHPAASGGGSSGGAGGAPSSPLPPAVGAETVAPTPVVAPVVPAATGSGAAGPGMSGTGGVAPMMHGGRAEGSADKKRNPRLTEDKELYTEDRPWTEAVIGNRARRRGAPDDTKRTSQ